MKNVRGLELFASASSGATSARATASATSAALAADSGNALALLGLGLWRVVHEQSVEWQTVRQDKVANVVAANGDGVHAYRLAVLHGQLDRFQVSVHAHVNSFEYKYSKFSVTQKMEPHFS